MKDHQNVQVAGWTELQVAQRSSVKSSAILTGHRAGLSSIGDDVKRPNPP